MNMINNQVGRPRIFLLEKRSQNCMLNRDKCRLCSDRYMNAHKYRFLKNNRICNLDSYLDCFRMLNSLKNILRKDLILRDNRFHILNKESRMKCSEENNLLDRNRLLGLNLRGMMCICRNGLNRICILSHIFGSLSCK
jgi:hypothetical protein